jgi:CTP:molybdopterin cytidylyltransferase MocA
MVHAHGLFHAIILAAGQSSRMKDLGPKGLLNYKGEPWLLYQIKRLWTCGIESIVVVLGAECEKYFAEIKELALSQHKTINFCAGPLVRTIINVNYERGQFSSLLMGLRHSGLSQIKGVFILPVDVPCTTPAVFEALANGLTESQAQACIPEYRGKGGHPVLLGKEFCDFLQTIDSGSPDARLDKQLVSLGANLKTVKVDCPWVTANINTPESWQDFLKRK